MTKFGLFDTKDKCWLGTNEGPNLYEDEVIARCAAEAIDWMAGWESGRTRAMPYDGTGTKLRDEVQFREGRNVEKWLEGKESGKII